MWHTALPQDCQSWVFLVVVVLFCLFFLSFAFCAFFLSFACSLLCVFFSALSPLSVYCRLFAAHARSQDQTFPIVYEMAPKCLRKFFYQVTPQARDHDVTIRKGYPTADYFQHRTKPTKKPGPWPGVWYIYPVQVPDGSFLFLGR